MYFMVAVYVKSCVS